MGAEIWHSHEFFRMSSSIIAKRSPVWPPGLKWCSGMPSLLAACGLRFTTALPYINKMLNETFVAAYIVICFTNVNRETKIGWVRPVCLFCKRANTQRRKPEVDTDVSLSALLPHLPFCGSCYGLPSSR